MRALQVLAATGVVALAALLGWHLTHQDTRVAKAVLHGKIVPAPRFHLARLGGGPPVTLAGLRGNAVVVNFWASDCIPCKQEMPRLQAASRRWAGKHVAIVGVDVLDSHGAATDFVRKHDVTYTIGYDDLGVLASRYGVIGTPTTFFIDRRGRIVKRILGPVPDAQLDRQIEHARVT